MKIPACPDEARDGWSGESNFKDKVALGEPSPINLQTTRSSSVSTVALSRGFGLFSFIPPLFDSLKNVRRQGRCGKPHDDGDSTDRLGLLSGLDSPRRLLTRLVANSDSLFRGDSWGRGPRRRASAGPHMDFERR